MTKQSLDAMKRGPSAYDSMCWMLRSENMTLVDIILKFKTIMSISVLEDISCGSWKVMNFDKMTPG